LVLAGVPAALTGVGGTGMSLADAAAWVALVVTMGCILADVQPRWAGTVVGALATGALLRMDPAGPTGASALLVALAAAAPALSAYRNHRREVPPRLRTAVVLAAWAAVLAVAGAGLAVLLGRGPVDTAMAEGRAGIDAAKRGERTEADAHLRAAVASLDDAEDAFDAWYAQPARIVPVVAPQVQALSDLSAASGDLALAAASAANQADYRGIAARDGGLDLERLAALEAPLVDIRSTMQRTRARAGAIDATWLLPPIRDRHAELLTQIDTADRESDIALQAVRALPDILGAHGLRRYFVAFTTPAESRGMGGFMGNWAELTAENGKLELAHTGRTVELNRAAGDPPRDFDAPLDYQYRYSGNRPQDLLQDVTVSPDFPSVAATLSAVYPQTAPGHPIDGVIALDPYTVAAMLRLTGPVSVHGFDEPLTAGNAADLLLRRQYVEFADRPERVDFLEEASRQTFDRLLHVDSITPGQLAGALGPMVEQRRLVAHSQHDDAQRLIERLGMDGAFPKADGGDLFAVVTQNGGNNKIDTFLHRAVTYRTQWDAATGSVNAVATVRLHNDAPAGGLPDYVIHNRKQSRQPNGTNWLWFNFYSPHDLVSFKVNGADAPANRSRELGLRVYHSYLAIPPGGDAVVELTLRGHLGRGAPGEVRWYQQPLVRPDDVTVAVSGTARGNPGSPPFAVDRTVTTVGDRDGTVAVAR
jgi:hypothetical protein